MSKCVYCHEKKGKRPCPALSGPEGGLICSACCGEHRVLRITCPADCAYLDASSEYQQKRVGERFALARRDFYRGLVELGGDKAAALFNLLEGITFSYFQDRRDGQDAEVVAAIQALRRTLSPLHIPAPPLAVFAEHMKKEYETFAKQQPQHQALDASTATEVLDRALVFIAEFSGHGLQSQRFLTGLIGYIRAYHPEVAEQLSKHLAGGRIVLPGQFAPGPADLPGPGGHRHTHDHTCRH